MSFFQRLNSGQRGMGGNQSANEKLLNHRKSAGALTAAQTVFRTSGDAEMMFHPRI
jgi:hypothetical protein